MIDTKGGSEGLAFLLSQLGILASKYSSRDILGFVFPRLMEEKDEKKKTHLPL